MDNGSSGKITDGADGTLSDAVPVLRTNTRETNSLREPPHIIADVLTLHDTIIGTKSTNPEAKVEGFTIQSTLATKGFGGVERILVEQRDHGGTMINEQGATNRRRSGRRERPTFLCNYKLVHRQAVSR